MASSGEQIARNEREENSKKGRDELLLPLESSPYVKYTNLEDYKRQGYGTEGHLQPKLGQKGCPTDAPTPSGNFPTEAHSTTHPSNPSH